MFESYGVAIGAALLFLVTICALAIGWRAARSVARFREEHHESFLGSRSTSPSSRAPISQKERRP